MSKKDEIYRKRLERIRDELDSYISCIDLPIPVLDVPKMVISQVSQNLSSQLEQKEFVSVAENVAREKEKDTAQETKKTVQSDKPGRMTEEQVKRLVEAFSQSSSVGSQQYLSTGRPSGASGGGSAGLVMPPQYLRKDNGRPDLDQVLAKKEESFSTMLLRLIDEKKMRDSDVYRRANIDRRLFSKIRSDAEYVPSKKTAISFCMALGLELEEAKKLLATAGYTLSNSSRFDLIIMYMIENCEFNIQFVNIVLDDYGEGTLSR